MSFLRRLRHGIVGKKKKKLEDTRTAQDILKGEGITKTDMYCHNCSKNFIASLDYSIEGKHIIECPWCHHEHCREIKDGKVTDDRWDSTNTGKSKAAAKARVWKAHGQPIVTTSASVFLREKWLNREM